MTDRLTYSLRRDEYVAALQVVVNGIMSKAAKREGVSRLAGFPYLHILVFGVASLFVIWRFPTIWASALAVAALFVSLHAAIQWYVFRSEWARLGVTFEERRHRDVTAVFDEEAAHYLGQELRQSWQWSLFRRFHDLPSVYVLEFIGHDMLVVPRRVFSSAKQATGWAADIRSRLPH